MKLIEAIRAFWHGHGTKILGTLQTFCAATLAAAIAMQSLMPVKYQVMLAGLTAFLGVWTIKRGFYNSKQQPPA